MTDKPARTIFDKSARTEAVSSNQYSLLVAAGYNERERVAAGYNEQLSMPRMRIIDNCSLIIDN